MTVKALHITGKIAACEFHMNFKMSISRETVTLISYETRFTLNSLEHFLRELQINRVSRENHVKDAFISYMKL